MLKKLILGSLVVVPVGAYYYHGFDTQLPILKDKVPAQSFLYIQHVGSYNKIGDTFKIIGKDFKDAAGKFQNSRHGAIYYDNPTKLKSMDDARAVAGVFFTGADKAFVESFVREHPGYNQTELPDLTTVSTKVPVKSTLSFVWLVKVIIPKIYDFFEKNNLGKISSEAPLIEYFELDGDSVKNIEAHIPYGNNLNQLILTKLREPPKK